MNRVKGFTLLEIMLVILLVGMISVGVVMTLPSSAGLDKNSQWHAQRFSSLLQFAQDHALIANKELGIEFSEQQYQFAYFDLRDKKWRPFSDSMINGYTQIPDSLVAEYSLSDSVWGSLQEQNNDDSLFDKKFSLDEDEQEIELAPQVFIMSSGEVTPFSYRLYALNDVDDAITVKVSMSGQVEVVHDDEE